MGFLDKLKGAVNAVTGGAAKVTMEFEPKAVYPGDVVRVKISATSAGGEVKSKGIFVDLMGSENVKLPKGTVQNHNEEIHAAKPTFQHEFQIAPALVLAAKETKLFEGTFTVPANVQPSYQGSFTR